jgi:hypothetical protein
MTSPSRETEAQLERAEVEKKVLTKARANSETKIVRKEKAILNQEHQERVILNPPGQERAEKEILIQKQHGTETANLSNRKILNRGLREMAIAVLLNQEKETADLLNREQVTTRNPKEEAILKKTVSTKRKSLTVNLTTKKVRAQGVQTAALSEREKMKVAQDRISGLILQTVVKNNLFFAEEKHQ